MHISITPFLLIKFDYDFELKEHLKCQLDGEWLPSNGCWMVPIENEAKARDAAVAMLGTDGTRSDTVRVMIVFDMGARIDTDQRNLAVGPIELLRTRRPAEKMGAYPHESVSIATGHAEFDRNSRRLVYMAPQSEHGRIVVNNVGRQRALRLQEQIRCGEMRHLQVIDMEILDDLPSQ